MINTDYALTNLPGYESLLDRAMASRSIPQVTDSNGTQMGAQTRHTVTEDDDYTELGNARRLVKQSGANIRYSHELGVWFVWNGKHWSRDTSGSIARMAKDMVDSLRSEESRVQPNNHREYTAHVKRSRSHRSIQAAINLAASEKEVQVSKAAWDNKPMLVNCQNGTIDLETLRLNSHNSADMITKCLSVDYDPNAACPQWETFISRIFDGRTDLIRFVQQTIGYSLTGETKEQCMFILHGNGQNGKSTFLEVVRQLLGDYARETPVQSILADNKSSMSNDIARLEGARFVSCREMEKGQQLAESKIKQMTGEDTVTARELYRDFTEFKPQFKIFLATNNLPVIKGTDDGIWRRLHIINMPVQISGSEQDRNLKSKLLAELPGILNWAVAGCQDWLSNGLDIPESVSNARTEYRLESDYVEKFISECCEIGLHYKEKAASLYEAYCASLESDEIRVTHKRFSLDLNSKGFAPATVEGARGRAGIRLKGYDSSLI